LHAKKDTHIFSGQALTRYQD